MTTPLSPAAQAVKDAAIDAWGDPRSTVQGIAAAALRAAVEQVVPVSKARTDRAAQRNKIHASLLAIATELEADS